MHCLGNWPCTTKEENIIVLGENIWKDNISSWKSQVEFLRCPHWDVVSNILLICVPILMIASFLYALPWCCKASNVNSFFFKYLDWIIIYLHVFFVAKEMWLFWIKFGWFIQSLLWCNRELWINFGKIFFSMIFELRHLSSLCGMIQI